MRTDEEEKSEARAFLRRFAAELTDWAAVDNCNAGVAAGFWLRPPPSSTRSGR